MSVLIKGMKMPKECRECHFIGYYWKSGETLCSANSKIIAYNFKPIEFDGRHHDCPLVEIPTPHGRLIDGDALKKEYPHDTDWDYPVNTNCYVVESIDKSPTVIEAEEDQYES